MCGCDEIVSLIRFAMLSLPGDVGQRDANSESLFLMWKFKFEMCYLLALFLPTKNSR